jgi:DNA primase
MFHDPEIALAFFKSQLFEPHGRSALEYLTEKRGYTKHEIEGMELGFSPPKQYVRDTLGVDLFEELGFDVKGLGRTHKIVIPYRNPDGGLKGFIIRRIDSKRPKYLYSAHLERDTLFNLSAVKGTGDIYVTEGYFDALVATQRGIKGVVSTGFSRLTERVLEDIMSWGIKCITLIPDNDVVGLKGAAQSIALLKGKEINTFVLELPEYYKDLDEFIRHEGIKAFEKLTRQVKNAENWEVQKLLIKRSNIKVQIRSTHNTRTAHIYYISKGNQNRQDQ